MKGILIFIATFLIIISDVSAYVVKYRGPAEEDVILWIGSIGTILGIWLFIYSFKNRDKNWAFSMFKWSVTILFSSIWFMIVGLM